LIPSAFTVLRLILWGRGQNIDLIHANDFKSALWVGLLGRALDARTVWHGHVFYRYGRLGRLAAGPCDTVIVNSEAVRLSFIAGGIPASKVVTVYNGLDLKAFPLLADKSGPRAALGLPPTVPVVGFVGRIAPRKGLEELLRSAVQVSAAVSDAHFLIAGDELFFDDNAGSKSAMQALSQELGIADRCHFVGFREDVPAMMAALDVLAFPSWEEPFGRSLIEAMAVGRPVVASDTGGVPEIVTHGETGLLVPPRDPPSLADALITVLRSPQQARAMGLRGRKVVEQRFTIQQHVEKIEALYRRAGPFAGDGDAGDESLKYAEAPDG
jgi:glycosyltransferase involved in cell wall biosynthesis